MPQPDRIHDVTNYGDEEFVLEQPVHFGVVVIEALRCGHEA